MTNNDIKRMVVKVETLDELGTLIEFLRSLDDRRFDKALSLLRMKHNVEKRIEATPGYRFYPGHYRLSGFVGSEDYYKKLHYKRLVSIVSVDTLINKIKRNNMLTKEIDEFLADWSIE